MTNYDYLYHECQIKTGGYVACTRLRRLLCKFEPKEES